MWKNSNFRAPLNTHKWVHTIAACDGVWIPWLIFADFQGGTKLSFGGKVLIVAKKLLDLVFSIWGIPTSFSSNWGTRCTGIVTRELFKALMFPQKFYCSYYSQSSQNTEKVSDIFKLTWALTNSYHKNTSQVPFQGSRFYPDSGSTLLWADVAKHFNKRLCNLISLSTNRDELHFLHLLSSGLYMT